MFFNIFKIYLSDVLGRLEHASLPPNVSPKQEDLQTALALMGLEPAA